MQELIKKDIEEDYFSCLGLFENVKILMTNLDKSKNNLNNSEFENRVIKNQKKELLVMLGRVGELAFKYLLKNKQIQMNPNQTYDQFTGKSQLFYAGTLKDMVEKGKLKQDDLEEILAYKDGTKADFHNFTYLGLIVEKVLPITYENIRKCFRYEFISEELHKLLMNIEENGEIEVEYEDSIDGPDLLDNSDIEWCIQGLVFPLTGLAGREERVSSKTIEKEMEKIKRISTDAGDAFTRLRYFSNNTEGKKYDLKQVYKYMEVLVRFIKGVQINHTDLLAPAEIIHGREMALKYSDYVGREKSEINEFFDKFGYDIWFLTEALYGVHSVEYCNRIYTLCKKYHMNCKDTLEEELRPKDIEYFHSMGIDDPFMMSSMIYNYVHEYDDITGDDMSMFDYEYDDTIDVDEIKRWK